MFRSHGTSRSDRQNRRLAGNLAFVGGYVNSAGFVLIGTFTSHVTGNVGRLATDVALGELHAALGALTMVVAFFTGAFIASVVVESGAWGRAARSYAVALAVEASLLFVFTGLAHVTHGAGPRVHDAEAALLCAAMGVQNSLVTRLSGAVVRTTHLTGVLTDLGIESARWFRFWRSHAGTRLHVPLVVGPNPAERPATPKLMLLVTIALAFVLGAMTGAIAVVRLAAGAMLVAAAVVSLFALYALRTSGPEEVSGSRK